MILDENSSGSDDENFPLVAAGSSTSTRESYEITPVQKAVWKILGNPNFFNPGNLQQEGLSLLSNAENPPKNVQALTTALCNCRKGKVITGIDLVLAILGANLGTIVGEPSAKENSKAWKYFYEKLWDPSGIFFEAGSYTSYFSSFIVNAGLGAIAGRYLLPSLLYVCDFLYDKGWSKPFDIRKSWPIPLHVLIAGFSACSASYNYIAGTDSATTPMELLIAYIATGVSMGINMKAGTDLTVSAYRPIIADRFLELMKRASYQLYNKSKEDIYNIFAEFFPPLDTQTDHNDQYKEIINNLNKLTMEGKVAAAIHVMDCLEVRASSSKDFYKSRSWSWAAGLTALIGSTNNAGIIYRDMNNSYLWLGLAWPAVMLFCLNYGKVVFDKIPYRNDIISWYKDLSGVKKAVYCFSTLFNIIVTVFSIFAITMLGLEAEILPPFLVYFFSVFIALTSNYIGAEFLSDFVINSTQTTVVNRINDIKKCRGADENTYLERGVNDFYTFFAGLMTDLGELNLRSYPILMELMRAYVESGREPILPTQTQNIDPLLFFKRGPTEVRSESRYGTADGAGKYRDRVSSEGYSTDDDVIDSALIGLLTQQGGGKETTPSQASSSRDSGSAASSSTLFPGLLSDPHSEEEKNSSQGSDSDSDSDSYLSGTELSWTSAESCESSEFSGEELGEYSDSNEHIGYIEQLMLLNAQTVQTQPGTRGASSGSEEEPDEGEESSYYYRSSSSSSP